MPADLTIFVSTDFLVAAGANGEYRLHAAKRLAPDRVLFRIDGQLTDRPTKYSIQVAFGGHIEVPPGTPRDRQLESFPWQFLKHSCEPNLKIWGRNVISLREIDATEELTFNFNTTEYDLAEPFLCQCGAAQCVGVTGGFRYLAISEQERLAPLLTDYLRAKVDGYGRASA